MSTKLVPMRVIEPGDLQTEMLKVLRRTGAAVSSGAARGLYVLVVTDEGGKLMLDVADMRDRKILADTVLSLRRFAESVEHMWLHHAVESLENDPSVPMAEVPADDSAKEAGDDE